MTGTRCSSACNRSSADMSSIPQYQQQNVERLTTSCDQTRSASMPMSNSVTTPVLIRNDSNHRTACARSVRVHTSAVKSTSLQRTKSQSATPSGKPQDSGPHQPASTSTHVPSYAVSHVAQNPSQHMSHQMRFNELPQNTFSHNTPLGGDVCNDSISVECPPPVDACSQRATKRDNAHQRHTRSVQSSSCAGGGFFS